MVLAVVLVALAGAEVQLGPAVGAVEQTGEHADPSCFCRPAFVLPQFLYPFPLSILHQPFQFLNNPFRLFSAK